MAGTTIAIANKPIWIDLATPDAKASGEFYSKLLGWRIEVNPDPQYGGYGVAKLDGADVAGIGPKQSPDAPTAWSLYIGTRDVDELAKRVQAAGGTVAVPAFEVGDQGRMAVFQDPAGAFISAWQATKMSGFAAEGQSAFAWAELSSRGLEKAIPFYGSVFGWSPKTSPATAEAPAYTEFQLDGVSIAGAMEMNPMAPAEMPSYWMAYLGVEDVNGSFKRALDLGAQEMLAPQDFPGGRFAILSDPQGAAFGLLRMAER